MIAQSAQQAEDALNEVFVRNWGYVRVRLASSDGLPPCQSPLATVMGESPPEGAVRTQIASQLAERLIYLV